MKRAILLGLGVAGLAVAAIPGLVSAQGFPPPPPTTYYGTVPTGVSPGDTVIAIVVDGTSATTCGDGVTSADASGVVYVVDVVADAQILGCGKAGRTVMFYFVGKKQLATTTAAWGGPGPAPNNLTGLVGSPLTSRNRLPHVARDGVN